MNRANRAAQFAPFDSLKGLQEELREREEKITREPKKELSEEALDALSYAVSKAQKGNLIDIIFYYNGHYIEVKDTLTDKSTAYRYLVVNNNKIFFDDILDLLILET